MADRPAARSAGGIEARLPCPVCLVAMDKAVLDGVTGALTLDHCARCGGVWFSQGEVQQLARLAPAELWAAVAPRADQVRPPCHGCGAPLNRDRSRCEACDLVNEVACPACDDVMTRHAHQGLSLDVCRRCRGVWFDHHELAAIWQMNLSMAVERRTGRERDALVVGGDVLMEAMIWSPGLVLHGAAGAAQVGGAAVEVVGSAAEGVFGAIMEIIGSLFE